MKKTSILIIALCTVFYVCGCTSTGTSQPKYTQLSEDEFKQYYTHKTIEEGSDEWNQLTNAQMWEQYSVDEDVLYKLSTNELMRVVLANPMTGVVLIYDTAEDAHDALAKKDRAYAILIERDDLETELERWKEESKNWGEELSREKCVIDIIQVE